MISREQLAKTWPTKKLGEVVEFLDNERVPVKESERLPGPYPYYGANGQQGTIDDYIFDEPLILLAEDGGHFEDPAKLIAYRICGKTWVNNHAHVLRPLNSVDIPFLCRQLEYYDVTPFITGTTRGKLTKTSASQIPVTLPPLPEQKRIAAILDKADAIRRKRAQALQLADEFLKAAFLDMFGDPVTNPKGWPERKLMALAQHMTDGPFGSNLKTEHYTDSGVRVIRLQNIGTGKFIDEDKAFVSEAHFDSLSRNHCFPGDVLIGTLGDPNLRACILPPCIKQALNKADCVLFRPSTNVLPDYVCWLLNTGGVLHKVAGHIHGQTRSRISSGQLKSLMVPMPPKELQKAFGSLCSHHAAFCQNLESASTECCNAFNSLVQRAFRGEL